MRVAEAVVRTLEFLGVRLIFGIPGSQTCPLYDALYDSAIRHILTRHEEGAAYMADAYAKATGRLGVCDGTGGPGATNLLTGIATAYTDSIPVLAITGQQPIPNLGKGAFQELDHLALFRPVVKWNAQIRRAEDAKMLVVEAFKRSFSGRPGPVHLDLPLDVQKEFIEDGEPPKPDALRIPKSPKPEDRLLESAASLLLGSERPLMILGGGAHYSPSEASKEALALAEHLAMPVVTTFNGRGAFPEDHPLSAGRMGVHDRDYTDSTIAEADVILAVGCRFAELSTRHWKSLPEGVRLIHVNVDASELGKCYPTELGIVGDAKETLRGILEALRSLSHPRSLEGSPWVQALLRRKELWYEKNRAAIGSEATPLKPQRICHELRRFFGRSTIFTMDAGNNKMWASSFLEIYEPRTWIQSGGFGPMGYALPAAIACKLAKPEANVVALCGDGGFSMTMYELSTAIQQNTPIVLGIMNDGALGTIRHRQIFSYGGRILSTILRNPDFVKLAESFDWHGERVERPGEIIEALKNAQKSVSDGIPALIDFRIDGNEPLPP
ncbi:MAG: thiamine pyrophosphate-binding protein [Candidatus Bathyarchaeia archaeon]